MDMKYFPSDFPMTMLLGLGRDKGETKKPRTLTFNKGVPIINSATSKNSPADAVELLEAQNGGLSRRLVELTYGPPRPHVDSFVPRYVQLDKKILLFQGVVKEDTKDWNTEGNRIRFVNVFYYLENDTLKVYEPRVPNSGLYQGVMFQRSRYPHHDLKRDYTWRDLNNGQDLHIFGTTVHLYDCDEWTRVFLTEQGIEVNEAELKPEDPYLKERELMQARAEILEHANEKYHPTSQFFNKDGRVLRFFGVFLNDKEYPTAVRRILLKYYLADDSIEVVENWPPHGGRGPSGATILKRQKVHLDRKKEVDKLPCYLQPTEDDDIRCFSWEDLRTGTGIEMLGKTFFLNKCDEFTYLHYKTHQGIDLPQAEIMKMPKKSPPMLLPPPMFGTFEETLEDCYKPHVKVKPKTTKIPHQSKEMDNTQLNFSAFLDTPFSTEHCRHFIINFFGGDHTVRIFEERSDGFMGGVYLQRTRLKKGDSALNPLIPSEYYEIGDFYVGAKIKACGNTFVIKDADLAAFSFMAKHPEIYPNICAKDQRRLANILKGKKEPTQSEKMVLLHELKQELSNIRWSKCFSPILESLGLNAELERSNLVTEKLYSANLPISQNLLEKLVDAFTFEGKTDAQQLMILLHAAFEDN